MNETTWKKESVEWFSLKLDNQIINRDVSKKIAQLHEIPCTTLIWITETLVLNTIEKSGHIIIDRFASEKVNQRNIRLPEIFHTISIS